MTKTVHILSAQHRKEIQVDKILLVHKNMPIVMLGNLLGSIPLTAVLWSENNAKTLIVWFCCLYLLTFLRWLHYRAFDNNNDSMQRIFQQGNVYAFFALLSGCAWGSAGVLFFNPDAVAQFTFLILTLVCMISGSMTSLSSRPLSYVLYAIPAMLPIIIKMFMQGLAFYNWMGAAALAYLLLTLAFSRNIYHAINESLTLKYENIDLLDDLKQQTDAANKASHEKSRFLATASHDLRQPLHAINLFVETLDNKIATSEQQHELDRIRKGLQSLGGLFDALLDISRLDSEMVKTERVTFQLDELIKKIIDQFSSEAAIKNLDVRLNNSNQIVYSDPIMLERILRNLLSNAIHYTEQGNIEIFCLTNTNDTVSIHVLDTGIGIAKENIDKIFDEFTQLHNPERDRRKGLGLGLAIVRRISDLLDHPISVKSEIGKGTEFIITVPLGKNDDLTKSISRISANENQLDGLQVLVVDNEIDILEAMQGLIESWNCQFIGADSTETTLKLLRSGFIPDIILADYRMPGNLNGIELIKNIRNEFGDLPALIISGDTSVEVINEIEKNKLILLHKPIKPAQLRIAIAQHVHKS